MILFEKNDSDEISEDGQGLTDVAVTFDSNVSTS